MKPFVLMSAAVMSLLVFSAAPAAAQSFVAEVDCGGVVAPGDTVPVTVRLESQSQQSVSWRSSSSCRSPALARAPERPP